MGVFLVTAFMVHEDFKPVAKSKMLDTKGVIGELGSAKLVFGMFVTTMIIQAANNSIVPILALYVRQIMDNSPATTLQWNCRGCPRNCDIGRCPNAWPLG